MATDVERLLDTFGGLRKEANVNACFGEPVTVEGRTVIPIARIGYGLGMGAGRGPAAEAEEELEMGVGGSGGAGAVMGSPLGVLEVTSQGTRVEPVIDRQMVSIVSMLVGAWSVFWLARALIAIFGRRD
jgi:uncharacterized spore protein YtfJ